MRQGLTGLLVACVMVVGLPATAAAQTGCHTGNLDVLFPSFATGGSRVLFLTYAAGIPGDACPLDPAKSYVVTCDDVTRFVTPGPGGAYDTPDGQLIKYAYGETTDGVHDDATGTCDDPYTPGEPCLVDLDTLTVTFRDDGRSPAQLSGGLLDDGCAIGFFLSSVTYELPEGTDDPDARQTGARIDHYVEPGGPFSFSVPFDCAATIEIYAGDTPPPLIPAATGGSAQPCGEEPTPTHHHATVRVELAVNGLAPGGVYPFSPDCAEISTGTGGGYFQLAAGEAVELPVEFPLDLHELHCAVTLLDARGARSATNDAGSGTRADVVVGDGDEVTIVFTLSYASNPRAEELARRLAGLRASGIEGPGRTPSRPRGDAGGAVGGAARPCVPRVGALGLC